MSLINEALKRAKQARISPPPLPTPDAAMQPVIQPIAEGPGADWLRLILSVTVLLLAFCFLGLWWRTSRVESAGAAAYAARPTNTETLVMLGVSNLAPSITPRSSDPVSEPIPVALAAAPPGPLEKVAPPAPTAGAASQPVAVVGSPGPNSITNSVPEQSTSIPAPQLPAPPVDWKLQGIFYRASKASVLINGQSLFLGDDIDGARVAAIDRNSVQLVAGGKTNVLKLR